MLKVTAAHRFAPSALDASVDLAGSALLAKAISRTMRQQYQGAFRLHVKARTPYCVFHLRRK